MIILALFECCVLIKRSNKWIEEHFYFIFYIKRHLDMFIFVCLAFSFVVLALFGAINAIPMYIS